jgi:glucan biosynthesis protein C
VLVVAPFTGYLTYRSQGIPMGLLKYWATDFWSLRYTQSVYWFLGVLILMLFYILVSLVYRLSDRLRSSPRRISHPSWKMLVFFWGITTLALFIAGELGVQSGWYMQWYVIVFQPWRVPLYVGYFLLGIIAYRRGWFTAEGYQPRLAPWLVLWVLSNMIIVGCRAGGNRLKFAKIFHMTDQFPTLLNAQNAVLFGTICLCSLMMGVAFCQRHFNGAGRLQKSLADSSYGIYFIHPTILYPLAYFFMSFSLPLYVKATTVIGLIFFLSWAASALVLRKAPILNRIF